MDVIKFPGPSMALILHTDLQNCFLKKPDARFPGKPLPPALAVI